MAYQSNYRDGYAPVGRKRYHQPSPSRGYGAWCKFIVIGVLLGLVATFVWNKSNGTSVSNQPAHNDSPKDDADADAWSNKVSNSLVDAGNDNGATEADDDGDSADDDDTSGDDEDYEDDGNGDDYNDPDAGGDANDDDATANDDDDGATEQVLDAAVGDVLQDLEDVETQELQTDEAKVNAALDAVIDKVREDVVAFVGDKLSEEQITSLTEDTAQHVRTHVSEELKNAAKEAVDEVEEQVEGLVDGELEDGNSMKQIDTDLHMHEGEALTNLRNMIKNAEANIEQGLYMFALDIEKDILEKRIGEMLGEAVAFAIVDGKLSDPNDVLSKLVGANVDQPDDAPGVSVDATAGGESTVADMTDEGVDGEGDAATVDGTSNGDAENSGGENVDSEPTQGGVGDGEATVIDGVDNVDENVEDLQGNDANSGLDGATSDTDLALDTETEPLEQANEGQDESQIQPEGTVDAGNDASTGEAVAEAGSEGNERRLRGFIG
ncbi:hypothetical protein MPSEU_000533300 [Mayamaea pseudoterrestris]|nr:hypothetical protein MPSEU_000533300 [Mayamaea pseudoterrestris]